MFNVILELISENRPQRNPKIFQNKKPNHTKEISYFLFHWIWISYFIHSFFWILKVHFWCCWMLKPLPLLGNAKDSEVCMYGFSIQFSCTILQFYCVSFNLLLEEYEEKSWKKSLVIISFCCCFCFWLPSILFAIWKILVVDACHGLSLLCCYILCCCHYFF